MNQFRDELLAIKYIEHSHADKTKYIQNIASSSFLTGTKIIRDRYKLCFELIEELAQLSPKQGSYIGTWSNGTEEHGPSQYDKEEVDALVKKAFDLCYDS